MSRRLHRARTASRGQTMVLFAMTLLLLALMVCMTLSFSMKIREKIETQTVADAAAYTNAVSTARAYNVISMYNRTGISHEVAVSGAESFISWATIYRAGISALIFDTLLMLPGTCSACGGLDFCACLSCVDLSIQFATLTAEQGRIAGVWDALDFAAGAQATLHNNVVNVWFYLYQMYQYNHLQNTVLGGQGLANSDVVPGANAAAVNPFGDLSAPGAADKVSKRETDQGNLLACLGNSSNGAGCAWNPVNLHAVSAAMSQRGWPFITGRWDWIWGNPLQWDLQMQTNGNLVNLSPCMSTPFGSDCFNPGLPWMGGTGMWSVTPSMPLGVYLGDEHGELPMPMGIYGIGEDHYTMTYEGPDGCSVPPVIPFFPLISLVRSGTPFWGGSIHGWFPEFPTIFGYDADPTVHDIGWVFLPQPGVWPLFIDYNWHKVADKTDNFGQPKTMAVIQRDYALRNPPDPWNLFFKFDFTTPAAPNDYVADNRGLQLLDSTFYGTDISKQIALSTGISYYHRYGGQAQPHWQEPPNFLNPFWRATLVAPDTDRQGTPPVAGYPAPWCGGGPCPAGQDDVGTTLNNIGASTWADTYHQLANKGFTGFQ